MNESYAEAGTKLRKKTIKDYAIRGIMVFLVVFFLTYGMVLIPQFSIYIVFVLIAACVFVFPRMNIEYEYVFCDGQLDFDKISGGRKRKTVLRIDFEMVEMVAPVKSHALDSYNNPQMKVRDFTSLDPHRNVYAIIFREEGLSKILFEPSEKMLDCMKQKAPRKVSVV